MRSRDMGEGQKEADFETAGETPADSGALKVTKVSEFSFDELDVVSVPSNELELSDEREPPELSERF